MEQFNAVVAAIGDFIWSDWVLMVLLATGLLFTIWSAFGQYRALTHGTAVLRGVYDDKSDPGAINHFQALSAALSATVGLGNIGGVALAVGLGGPGAVFWMWVVGLVGMAIKMTEVTLSMLYRNTDDPDNPHGGPMWVASKAVKEVKPSLAWLGKSVGVIFCITLLIYTITGGNMFQAWNVGEITQNYFGVPTIVTGIVLAILVGMVIIGGVKRIGRVAGSLVPVMVVLYMAAAIYVMIVNYEQVPELLKLIVVSAFSEHEAAGAFVGGTMGYALLIGMQRALFSSEAGVGSSPIAHSAARTDEPVREAVVAGLEPFIDTLVVCTFTALVILSTGMWDRGAEAEYSEAPRVLATNAEQTSWSVETTPAPERQGDQWTEGDNVFLVVEADKSDQTGMDTHRLGGVIVKRDADFYIEWGNLESEEKPELRDTGIFVSYPGATLTAVAFDSVVDGLGKWLVTAAVWLFGISTMISWSYYGEQGVVYLFGTRAVFPYKVMFCLLIVVATVGFIETETELNNFSTLGTGVMLWANVPIMWFFGYKAMRAYKEYMKRLKAGEMEPDHKPRTLLQLMSGKSDD